MAERGRRGVPADQHRHGGGHGVDPDRQGGLHVGQQQARPHGNALCRALQRTGLPHPQPQDGRRGQRGRTGIRILRGAGPGGRGRELLVRLGVFADRNGLGALRGGSGGRCRLRCYGARHHRLGPDALPGRRRSKRSDVHGPHRLRLRRNGGRRDRQREQQRRNHGGEPDSEPRGRRQRLPCRGHRRLRHQRGVVAAEGHHLRLHQLRRDDLGAGPDFGHRRCGQPLHPTDQLRQPRRSTEHLPQAGRRPPGSDHLHHGHGIVDDRLHELRRPHLDHRRPHGRHRLAVEHRDVRELRQLRHDPQRRRQPRRILGLQQRRSSMDQLHRRRQGGHIQQRYARLRFLFRSRPGQLPGQAGRDQIDADEHRLPTRQLGRRRSGRRSPTAHPLHRQQFHQGRRGAPAGPAESRRHRQGENDAHVLRGPHSSRVQQRIRHRERLPLL